MLVVLLVVFIILYYIYYAFAGLESQLPCFWTETLSDLQKLQTIYLHLDSKHKVCIHFKINLSQALGQIH